MRKRDEMKKKSPIRNRYQIIIRIAVIALLLFLICFSFGFELLFNSVH